MQGDINKFQDTTINDADLDGELIRQTASFVFVAQHYTAAEAEYERYKLRVNQLRAALDEKIRIAAAQEGKKITEAAIAKEIERHPDYVKAMEHQINLYKRKEDLKYLTQGWRDRKDLLIERCRKDRDEMKSLGSSTVLSAVG